jgi:hypothetical protein
MDTIIAYRINDGRVEFVMERGMVAVFSTRENAAVYAFNNRLFASGQAEYQIIELDEI